MRFIIIIRFRMEKSLIEKSLFRVIIFIHKTLSTLNNSILFIFLLLKKRYII